MLENLLVENIWLSVVAWSLLYISDYYLTIYGAQLYHAHGIRHLVFEGSYELTPYYQKDINALRLVSPKFLFQLCLSDVALIAVWFLSVRSLGVPGLFSFLIGALILSEVVVHIRHIRNIYLFSLIKNQENELQGRLVHPRWMILKLSALRMLSFSLLFLLVFLITNSWFFLGGMFRCLVIGLQHRLLAKKAVSQ